jgi:hypothetical protein
MRIGERRRQTSDLTPRDATRLETSSREAYQAFLKVDLCSPSDKAQPTPGGKLDSTLSFGIVDVGANPTFSTNLQ